MTNDQIKAVMQAMNAHGSSEVNRLAVAAALNFVRNPRFYQELCDKYGSVAANILMAEEV